MIELFVWLIVGFIIGLASSAVVWFNIYTKWKASERAIYYITKRYNTRSIQVAVLRNQLENKKLPTSKDSYGKVCSEGCK
jgi:hypothetical protein